jgi:hypothetical protein
MLRHDPREAVLADLNRLRERRLDADPSDHDRLTGEIDQLLERLAEMSL